MEVRRINSYDKITDCPPDKSESVRAVLFAATAGGTSSVGGISLCDDVLSAVACARALGATVDIDGTVARITGTVQPQSATLYCGNSAACARMLMGLLCGKSGEFIVTGDASLSRRPMDRVIRPLRAMGADIVSDGGRLPVKITGAKLRGVDLFSGLDSAQVKSAVLLAGLAASGRTSVTERVKTRDHTEIMLERMGADITVNGNTVTVGKSSFAPLDGFTVRGDVSAAVYPVVLALCARGGRCTVRGVSDNATRTRVWDILRAAGGDITFLRRGTGSVDITARRSKLSPLFIDGNTVPYVIDEIPALCALACFIDGTSVISGAAELRVKESDRIAGITAALGALGADIRQTHDGVVIRGGKPLVFGKVKSDDHRIVMSAAVAAALGGGAEVNGECVGVSYPQFFGEVLGQ